MGGVRDVVVHIGTHKTGTTALQRWARLHEPRLMRRNDIGVYRGLFGNAREVALLCCDEDRVFPTMRQIPEWNTDEWQDLVRAHVASELDRSVGRMLLSCETLAFLRRPSEVDRLAALLDGRRVRIVLCTRRPADFLRSWSDHLTRDGFSLSDDPGSFAYVGTDSWLVDYDALSTAFSSVFGAVTRVDYDAEMARHRSIIPGLMRASFGDIGHLPEWRGFRANLGTYRVDEAIRERRLSRRIARAIRDPLGALRRLGRRLRP